MHFSELTPPEQRVLGCLIEKRWTTPEQYPLSLNALRLACNQSTNRDPVTDYDEATVRDAAQRLSLYGLARLASGHGSRATKYRHLGEEALGLDREELAVLAVLLLRGPQTPGELKARTERMAQIGSLAQVEEVMAALSERGYARRLPRRPGQKEDRFEHLLGGAAAEGAPAAVAGAPASEGQSGLASLPSASVSAAPGAAAAPGPAASNPAAPGSPAPGAPGASAPPPRPVEPAPSAPAPDPALLRRVETLEGEVATLRAGLEALQAELGVELPAASDRGVEPPAGSDRGDGPVARSDAGDGFPAPSGPGGDRAAEAPF